MMNKSLFENIIKEFVPSPVMQAYLKDQNLPTKTVVDLILGSIASLEKKLEWIKEIYDEKPTEDVATVISDIEGAISYLEGGENIVFTTSERTFDEYSQKASYFPLEPAKNWYGIDMSIYHSDEGFNWDSPVWWEVESYVLDSHGLYRGGEYQYCYAHTEEGKMAEPVFFIIMPRNENGCRDCSVGKERMYRYTGGWAELKLGIPFKKGIMVKLHGLPFENERMALLIEDDPDELTAVSYDNDGKEEIINLSKGKRWLRNLNSYGVAPYYRMDFSLRGDCSQELKERFDILSKQLK